VPATSATEALWLRLARPLDAAGAVEAVLGLPGTSARQLVGAMLATADESETLLERMPHIVRSLTVSTVTKAQRCHGEIRGPVMWAETIGARSASAGDAGLFVCARPEKFFDTPENQLLVAALWAIRDAARAAEAGGHGDYDDDVLRRARHNGHIAMHFLDHRALVEVTRSRPTGRSQRRARAGARRRTYGPALAVIARAAEPLTPGQVALYADKRTTDNHDLFLLALSSVASRGVPVPRVRAAHGELVAGPVRFLHPTLAERRHAPGGVSVGGHPVASARGLDAVVDAALDVA
jgi:hypothetical protein